MGDIKTRNVDFKQADFTQIVDFGLLDGEIEFQAMNFKEISAARLKRARLNLPKVKGRYVKQNEVADLAGISAQRYGNYEQGTRSPDPDTMLKLADVLKEPAGYLAGLVNDPSLIFIIRAYEGTDSRGRRTILDAARNQVEGKILPGAIEMDNFFDSDPEPQVQTQKQKPGNKNK